MVSCRGEHQRSWLVRAAVAAACAVLWSLSLPATAEAHPILLESSPADGEMVKTPPDHVELRYSEPVSPQGLDVGLYDDSGDLVASSVSSRGQGAGGPAPRLGVQLEDGGHLVVLDALPRLPRGVFELRWSAVSTEDLHRLDGTVVFGVGTPAKPAGASPAGYGPLDQILLGWVDLIATSGLVGGVVVWGALVPWVRRRPDTAGAVISVRVVRIVVATAVFASLTAATLRLMNQLQAAAGLSHGWQVLVSAHQLTPWLLRLVSLSLLVVLVRRLGVRGGHPNPAVGLLVAIDVWARASTSHAQSGWATRAVVALHEGAAFAWLGGLFAVLVLVANLPAGRASTAVRSSLWRGFGLIAVTCVSVLAVSGVLLTGGQVATIDAMLTTSYGHALLAKLLVAAVIAALGLRHALHHHPWIAQAISPVRRLRRGTPPRRSLLVECAAGGVVVMFAAVLASTQPATGPQFAAAPGPVDRVTTQADGLLVTAAVRPNHLGRSLATVDIVSTRRPVDGTIERVRLTWGAGANGTQNVAPISVDEVGQGRWQHGLEIDVTGRLPYELVVQRRGAPDVVIDDAFVVPGSGVGGVLVSDSPLRPWTFGAAGLLVALILIGFARARRWAPSATETVAPAGHQAGSADDQTREPAGV